MAARALPIVAPPEEVGHMSLDAIHYTLKSLVNFTCGQLLYRSRADTAASGFPLFMGEPAHEWKDFRSEGGTIFSF